jgi:hypothetical protein
LFLGGFVGFIVRLFGLLASVLGVFLSFGRMLLARFVVALAVLFRSVAMGLCSFVVMVGGVIMLIFWHL